MKTLPYWIEAFEDGKYYIWTKVDIFAYAEREILIKKDHERKPDGNKVFIFFDDFEGNSLDTNKWELGENTSTSVNNSLLTIHHVGSRGWKTYIQTKDVIRLDKTITKIKFRQLDTNKRVPDFRTFNGNGGFVGWSDGYEKHRAYFYGNYKPGSQYIGGSTNWEFFEFITLNDRTITKFRNETLTQTGSFHNEIYDKLYIGDGDDWGTDNDALQIDYIFVRKYADIEPVINITQIDDDTWKVTIYNPNKYDLLDYQIRIDGNSIVDNEKEGLLLTTPSYKTVSTEYTSLFLRNGYVTIKDLNKHNVMIRYIITFDKATDDFHICHIGDCYIYTKDGKLYIDDKEMTLENKNQIIIDVIKNSLINIIANGNVIKVLPFDKVKIGNNVDVSIKVVTIIK